MYVSLQRNSAYSFTGCVKNLQLDGQWLSSVSETFGVTPCYEGLSEAGTYFSKEGGYVVLGNVQLRTENKDVKFKSFALCMNLRCVGAAAREASQRPSWKDRQLFGHRASVVLHGSLDFLLENIQEPFENMKHSVQLWRDSAAGRNRSYAHIPGINAQLPLSDPIF